MAYAVGSNPAAFGIEGSTPSCATTLAKSQVMYKNDFYSKNNSGDAFSTPAVVEKRVAAKIRSHKEIWKAYRNGDSITDGELTTILSELMMAFPYVENNLPESKWLLEKMIVDRQNLETIAVNRVRYKDNK